MNKFLSHIAPQMDELVSDLFNNGYTPECINKPLNNEFYWYQHDIFNGIKFHFDSAELTLVGWLSAREILTESFYDFNLELIAFIRSTVEWQWEIRMKEALEDLIAEGVIAAA